MNSILPLLPALSRPLTPTRAISRRRALASVVFAAAALFQSTARAEPIDNWTKVTANSDAVKSPNDMIFANQEFWAVGGAGKVQHSTNGVSWNVVQTTTTNPLTSLVYANGMYVATGRYMTILSSPDGVNW